MDHTYLLYFLYSLPQSHFLSRIEDIQMQKIFFLASALVTAVAVQAAEPTTDDYYEELTVTASRIEQPLRQIAVSMSVIDAETIELKGYNSLADLLRFEPSVGVSNNGGRGQVTALRIRGEEQYRTLLLVDSVDLSDPSATQHGPLLENFLAAGDIERVEILRGPQGFAYGADAGGVVNIITRDGSDGLGARLFAETGSVATRNLNGTFTAGDETANVLLNLAEYKTDGFNARVADTELNDDDGSENTAVHFKGKWQPTDDFGATLVYRDTELDYDYDYCFNPTTYELENECSGENDQKNLKITVDYQIGRYQQSFAYAATDIERSTYTFDDLTFATDGTIDAFNYLGQLAVTAGQRWIVGADLRSLEMSNNYGNAGERDQTGLYSEYQWQPVAALYLTAGLRYDDFDDFGSNTSGRLSAAWYQEMDGLTLKYRATYGTGFRAPSLYELSYNAGPYEFGTTEGVELKEETSKGYDLGVDITLESGLMLQLTYFDQKVENQIYYEYDLTTYTDGYRQDDGESTSKGVEVSLSWPVMVQLTLEAGLTYNEANDSDGNQRVRRPRNIGSVSVQWNSADERFKVLVSGRYSHNAVDTYSVELDDYEVVDLSASYQLYENFEVFGRVENLTDADYVEVSGYNSADRSAYAGVRVSF